MILTLNNKEYAVPELGFPHVRTFENMGVDLVQVIRGATPFKGASAFVSVVAGVSPSEADEMIETHVLNGGRVSDIVRTFCEALMESRFFSAWIRNELGVVPNPKKPAEA